MARNQLSDNWRRTICRFVFLLFCVAPTGVTGYWIFHPQTAGQWEQTIRAELGIPTEIDSVETPGPNVTILRGIRLTDPLTGELFSTTQVRVIRGNPNRIVIDYPTTVSCQSLVKLIKKSAENLPGSRMKGVPWRIEFADTTTITNKQTQYIQSLVADAMAITLAQYANGPAAVFEFGLKREYPTSNLITGALYHAPDKPPVFELTTRGNFLPCWLLSDLVPDLKKLGSECEFEGTIHPIDIQSERSVCQIVGTFTRLDLSKLVSPFSNQLSGVCTSTVDLVISAGQIFSLNAKIGCGRGEIGTQLLMAARDHLGFETVEDVLRQDGSLVEFRNMELACRLERGRISFKASNNGVVAFDNNGKPSIGYFETEDRSLDELAMFLVRPNATDERWTKEMLAVLSRFHRPAPTLVPGPVHRTADRNESPKY